MAVDRCDVLCLDLELAEDLRRRRAAPSTAVATAKRAKALADPTRVEIALALRDAAELCVCDLAWILERSQNLTSHHLAALRNGRVVESRRDGKMVIYRLTETGRRVLDAVLGEDVALDGVDDL